MENKSGINYQELSALARILNRALTADERVSFMDWVDASYDFLEEACNDVSIDVLPVIDDFKTTLLSECVDVLDGLRAYEKFNYGFQEFMTADEYAYSEFLTSTGEDFNPLVRLFGV